MRGRPETWTIATRATKDEIDAMRRQFAPRAEVEALVERDLAAARETAAEAAQYNAEAVGLPGITRGTPCTYLDDQATTRRGEFVRVALYGTGTGRRFRLAYRRVVLATAEGAEVHVDPALVAVAAAAALPECATFVGTGRRCTECRIHRNLHA